MIDISKNRELESIANDWAKDVIAFLTDTLAHENRVTAIYNEIHTQVDKRLTKYEKMFGEKCRIADVSQDEWQRAWTQLKSYLTDCDKLTALPDSLETEK